MMLTSLKFGVTFLGVVLTFLVARDAPVHAADLPVPRLGLASMPDADRPMALQARFAFNLMRELARDNPRGARERNANIIVSPASIAAVLAVLDLGADAAMQKAIRRTLGFETARAAPEHASLDSLRASFAKFQGNADKGPLLLANAIVFDPTSRPHAEALARLREAGADARVEDLAKPETLKGINDWVAANTRGLIPSILDEPPRDAGLVALNALYFKNSWRLAFDPKDTRPAPFRVLNSTPVEVPMMRQTDGNFRFRRDDRFIAADLPFASEGFSLAIVTSRAEPLPALAFTPVASWLTGEGFSESPGEVALPRFSLSQSAELLRALDALGLRSGRSSPTALSGFSEVPQAISRVMQKAVLRVDEAGAEAAAATAVVTTRSAPVDFVKLTVDKPFVFALRDARSGAIVMAGYVGKPE